jgi:hypothetical protein
MRGADVPEGTVSGYSIPPVSRTQRWPVALPSSFARVSTGSGPHSVAGNVHSTGSLPLVVVPDDGLQVVRRRLHSAINDQ